MPPPQPTGSAPPSESGGSPAQARLLDAAVVAVLLVGGLVLLGTYRGRAGVDDLVPYAAADVRGTLLVAATTVPLWWRRDHPLATTAVVAAAALLLGLLTYAAPLAGLSLLVAAYSCGAFARFRAGVAGLAVTATVAGAYLQAINQRYPEIPGTDPVSILVNLVAFGGAWALGRSVRNRRLHTEELVDRADRLERTRAAEVRAALAEERGRIARELHDVVAHHVSVMTVQAAGARRTVDRDPAASAEAMASVEATGRAALAEMRRIVGVLRQSDDIGPGARDGAGSLGAAAHGPQPGLADLPTLVAQVREAGLDVDFEVRGGPNALPAGVELTTYRIVQESLTNTLKHAGPARARVLLEHGPSGLDVVVSDTGHGPTPGSDAERPGHGLLGMRERVVLYGGSLQVGPRPGGGFLVRAHIPAEARGDGRTDGAPSGDREAADRHEADLGRTARP